MSQFFQFLKIVFIRPFLIYEKEITKISLQIYSQRKSSDSEGSFGFKRAGKIN